MGNPVNEWIRAGGTPKEKDKRRYIVAGVLIVLGIAFAVPTYGISLIAAGIGLVKVRNALKDDT